MKKPDRERHHRFLFAAFALVAAVFLTAAIVSQRSAMQIDAQAADLKVNSLPSVTNLTKARTSMGRLMPEIEALADADPAARPAVIDRIAELRRDLQANLDAAFQTPWYPSERELYEAKLLPSLARFDRDLARFTHDPDGNARTRLADERHLVLDADAADEALAELVEVNHAPAYAAMNQILAVRAQTAQLAFALELASALVAAVAAWFAVRVSRQFEDVLRRNAALQEARAEEFEAFAQRVAHNLLSPLSGVVFSLGAIERMHPDAQTKEVVKRTLRSLGRSRQMVHGIFNFARAGARPAQGVHAPLRAGVLAAVEELQASELPPPKPVVHVESFEECEVACDEAVLGVMLSNLLSNAEKYTRESANRRIVVRARASGDVARVEVEDSGPGLPPGLEHTIFEPYVRAPGATQPGLGLGLATVKRFAVHHGGQVGVRRAETGTVFWFELPRAKPRPSVEPPSRAPDSTPQLPVTH